EFASSSTKVTRAPPVLTSALPDGARLGRTVPTPPLPLGPPPLGLPLPTAAPPPRTTPAPTGSPAAVPTTPPPASGPQRPRSAPLHSPSCPTRHACHAVRFFNEPMLASIAPLYQG